MKRERKVERHDYTLVDFNEEYGAALHSKEYFGIFVRNGRVHVDTKRFKKVLERIGADAEFWREGMNANRSTPYLIPKKKHSDDYGVNISLCIIRKLRADWHDEFLPAIMAIKTPAEVAENARMGALAIRSGEDAMEEAQMIAMCRSLERMSRYNDVITSLYCSYIQRIASECDRAMALMFRKRGNVGDAFTFEELIGHINELAAGDKKKRLDRVKQYNAFESIRKLDNFLKHHTVKSYQAVKKYCPQYLAEQNKSFQNGMYAPDLLSFPDNFIEDTLIQLEVFFADFCFMFFGERAEETEWNNDDYFLHVYDELNDEEVWQGIWDKWGNCLVG